jgi:hypothetical protein
MNLWKMTSLLLLVVVALLGGSAVADRARRQEQPQMEAALTSLKDARNHLDKATADKGGHRVEALKHVNAAIDEVEKGIAYDNTHK